MDNATRCPQAHSHHSSDEFIKGNKSSRGARSSAAPDMDRGLLRSEGCGRGLPPVRHFAADIAEVAAALRTGRRGRPEGAESVAAQLAHEEGECRCGAVDPLPAPRAAPRREA